MPHTTHLEIHSQSAKNLHGYVYIDTPGQVIGFSGHSFGVTTTSEGNLYAAIMPGSYDERRPSVWERKSAATTHATHCTSLGWIRLYDDVSEALRESHRS